MGKKFVLKCGCWQCRKTPTHAAWSSAQLVGQKTKDSEIPIPSDGCELLKATHVVWKMIQKRIASPRKFQGTFPINEICKNCRLRMALWSVLRLRCCRDESQCSVGGGVSMTCVKEGERKKIGRQGGSSRGHDKDMFWT